MYAQVRKMLGRCYLEAICFEEKDGFLVHRKCLCHIRGKMFRKVLVNENDIVLVSLREFEYDKADVIHKYSKEEGDYLKSIGEIPENGMIELFVFHFIKCLKLFVIHLIFVKRERNSQTK